MKMGTKQIENSPSVAPRNPVHFLPIFRFISSIRAKKHKIGGIERK